MLFSLAHLDNPEVSARAIGNIALAGILLSLAFYTPRRHVDRVRRTPRLECHTRLAGRTGERVAVRHSLYRLHDGRARRGSPAARFGPEGGLLGTIAITAAIVVAARWARKEAT